MDLQDQFGYSGQPDFFKSARHFIGIVLIVVGCVMALFIFIHLYQLIKKPEQIKLFTYILPDDPNIRELTIDGKQISIPMGVFYFLAYLVMAIFLSIASGIGIAFIKAGAGLIYPRVDRLDARLTKESMKLNALITRLKYRTPPSCGTSPQQNPSREDAFRFGINREEDDG